MAYAPVADSWTEHATVAGVSAAAHAEVASNITSMSAPLR
jgi:hypothetical protein